jgi:hypothetical protein
MCPHSRVQTQVLLEVEEEGVSDDSHMSSVKSTAF